MTTEEQYDFLFKDHSEGNLSGRVVSMECAEGSIID